MECCSKWKTICRFCLLLSNIYSVPAFMSSKHNTTPHNTHTHTTMPHFIWILFVIAPPSKMDFLEPNERGVALFAHRYTAAAAAAATQNAKNLLAACTVCCARCVCHSKLNKIKFTLVRSFVHLLSSRNEIEREAKKRKEKNRNEWNGVDQISRYILSAVYECM